MLRRRINSKKSLGTSTWNNDWRARLFADHLQLNSENRSHGYTSYLYPCAKLNLSLVNNNN